MPPPCLAAKDLAKKTSEAEDDRLLSADTLAGLELRNLGPAINSGRVTDFAVTPGKRHRYFVVVAALKALMDDGELPPSTVAMAIEKYGIDPDKPYPPSH